MHSVAYWADPTVAPAPLWGRADEFAQVVRELQRGRSVLVEGEKCTGKSTMRNAVANAAARLGHTVLTVRGALQDHGSRRILVIDDLDVLDEQTIAEFHDWVGHHDAQVMLTRRPLRPFVAADTALRIALLDGATVVGLRPLTRKQNDELVNEYAAANPGVLPLCSVERMWVWKVSGGFPTLIRALLRDLENQPTGSHERFSPATVVVASGIVGALPLHLQQVARDLAPLAGVSYTRLLRGFRRAELDLLCDCGVVSNRDGVLVIPPPIQMALTLLHDSTELGAGATEVILDIATSVEVVAEYSEAELAVAANAMTNGAHLNELVSLETRETVMSSAMWLARRRGDRDAAAVLARRFTVQFPARAGGVVRTVARGARDDFEFLATAIADIIGAVSPRRVFLSLNCMDLPQTMSDPHLEQALETWIRLAPAEYDSRSRALLASLRAAQLLESGDCAGAIAIGEGIVANPRSGSVALLRALTVMAAAHAINLNGDALLGVTHQLVGIVRANAERRSLMGGLARRQANDAMLFVSLALASAGVAHPAALRDLVEVGLEDAISACDCSALVRMILCRMLIAAQERDQREFEGIVRFLRREPDSEHTVWLLTFLDTGDVSSIPDIEVSSFLRYGVHASLLLTTHAQGGPGELELALETIAQHDTPLLNVVAAYVDATGEQRNDLPLPEQTLLPGSLPAAYVDFVVGLRESDTEALRRAIDVFLARGLPDDADRTLRVLAPLVNDAESERHARLTERNIRAQMRAYGAMVRTLTVRERQVAKLAADGLSNRDIARELYLSVRTVESHLYRAMSKLAVSREEISDALDVRPELD